MKNLYICTLMLCPGLLFAQSNNESNNEPNNESYNEKVHDEHAQHAPASSQTLPTTSNNATAMEAAHAMSKAMHGGSINWLLMADRFEFIETAGSDELQWEAQGWLGSDLHKLWLKTEGEYEQSAGTTEAEVQMLYSRAIAPFWDLQAGIRHDEGEASSRDYAVLGVAGLAPYWFEVDAAAFLSETGKLGARLEVEYELRFTQRLLLQPRLELNYAFADDAEAERWQGMQEASFGVRLRYEVLREFAPYVGVEWSRAYGKTASVLQGQGLDQDEARVLAGVRIWY